MKKKYITLYIVLLIYYSIALINYESKGIPLNEIWCFGFSKRIADGQIPYLDFNVVVTPLFFYIGSIFTKSLTWYRIYAAIIDASIIVLIIYIGNIHKVEKRLSVIIALLVGYVVPIPILFANYNLLLLCGLMISYIIAIKFGEELDGKYAFFLGLILSFVLLIKQNIPAGLIVCISTMLFYLFIRKMIPLKTLLFYVAGGILPISFFVVYSLKYGFLNRFVDFTILGPLYTFSNNYLFEKATIILILSSAVITTFLIINVFKNPNNNSIAIITLIFSLNSYTYIYPIVDIYHSWILLIYNIFLSIVLLNGLHFEFTYSKPIRKGLGAGISILYLAAILNSMVIDEGYLRSNINHYENIILYSEFEKSTQIVSDYIKGQEKNGVDVAIISYSANFYNIPADDSNGVLDLLVVGNMGTLSNREIISVIDCKDIILTNNAYDFLDLKDVREYIFYNFIKEGTIGPFTIYRNPNRIYFE